QSLREKRPQRTLWLRHASAEVQSFSRKVALILRSFHRLRPARERVTEEGGGGSGIRTHVTVSRKHAFQACAFSHSATPPERALARATSYYINARNARFCARVICISFPAAIPTAPFRETRSGTAILPWRRVGRSAAGP